MTTNEMTPADFAAVTGNNGNAFGGDNAWWIIILFLFAFVGWGNGNGGVFGGGSGASDNYVLASDFATLQRQIDTTADRLSSQNVQISNGLCDGFYAQAQLVNGVNMNLANGFAQAELARTNGQTALLQQMNANNITAMQNQNALQTQIAECCCQNRYDDLVNANATQNAISTGFCSTNYNNATNTRDIIDNQNANARAILDALSAQQTESLKERIAEQAQTINALQLSASQSAQNSYLISQLRPAPVPSFPVSAPYQYGGCNCGA